MSERHEDDGGQQAPGPASESDATTQSDAGLAGGAGVTPEETTTTSLTEGDDRDEDAGHEDGR